VRRHEALRTRFEPGEGGPVQVVGRASDVSLPVADLRRLAAVDRQDAVRTLAREEARRPFDPARGPLFRAGLWRLGDRKHVLWVVAHRLVFDDRSVGFLLNELAALYLAASEGRASPLPAPPVQYARFARWQRRRLEGAPLVDLLGYWTRRLEGAPALLELPADRPRPPYPSGHGGRVPVQLPPALVAASRDQGLGEGVPPYVTLMTAFMALLGRYTGREDVVVGFTDDGRTRRATEGLIGPLADTLVLRTDLSGDPTFRQALGAVWRTVEEARRHRGLPLARLIEALRPEQVAADHGLIQAEFRLGGETPPRVSVGSLVIEPYDLDAGLARCDLELEVAETLAGCEAQFRYSADLFDEPTVGRASGHLRTLLEAAAADPDRRLSELPILTEAERHRVLVEWNDTAAAYPREACAHELFEAQAQRTPDAVAVASEGRELTYRELDRRANQLAHHLRGLGVGPDVLVGVCVDRSPEMVVGLLGILKAGGAYVPLDTSYPEERLAFMLADSGVPVLLTQEALIGRLPPHAARLVCLDRDWEAIARAPETPPGAGATAGCLAYVIYTSGSTGVPKGVMIVHRGLVNYLTWCTRAYPVAEGHGAPVHSPISFDLTVTSLFAPLVSGRRVDLLAEGPGVEPLVAALRGGPGFSLVKITPAHLHLLNLQVPPREAAGLTRAFVIGGEQLLAESLAFWREWAPDTLLINEYGPTESVVGCCTYTVPRGAQLPAAVPIGRPIANTQLFILDRHLQPVPIGVAGELYIGGDGLARGYLNRPELTAERFVPNPFGPRPSSRLYKTGDLARYRPDGTLEFLGRLDHQVKVRGFRIELEEIEAVLDRHFAVREACAAAREDRPGDQRLVAYVAPRDGAAPTPAELRDFLKERLPGYMVPADVVLLGALPLTPNGKVDRSALPAPDRTASTRASYVAPADGADGQMARLWEEVFGAGPVGIRDDFFELGGHSLLAARLLARVEQVFGTRLPPAALVQAPTVEQLASLLAEHRGVRERVSSLVAVTPRRGARPPFHFLPGGTGCLDGRDVIGMHELAQHLGPDYPLSTFEFDLLGRDRPPGVGIPELAAQFVRDLRDQLPRGPYHLGGYSFGGLVAFEMARLLHAQGAEVGLLALFDSWGPRYPRPLPPLARAGRRLKAAWRLALEGRGDVIFVRLRRWGTRRLRGLAPTSRRMRAPAAPVAPSPYGALDRAASSYFADARPFPGHLTLFRALEYPELTRFTFDDPHNGWGPLVMGGIEVHPIPGTHFMILQDPGIGVLTSVLKTYLGREPSGLDLDPSHDEDELRLGPGLDVPLEPVARGR
jgi:amino acid adenylation domain-containing protein